MLTFNTNTPLATGTNEVHVYVLTTPPCGSSGLLEWLTPLLITTVRWESFLKEFNTSIFQRTIHVVETNRFD